MESFQVANDLFGRHRMAVFVGYVGLPMCKPKTPFEGHGVNVFPSSSLGLVDHVLDKGFGRCLSMDAASMSFPRHLLVWSIMFLTRASEQNASGSQEALRHRL